MDETVIHDRSIVYSTRSILVDEIMEELRRLVTEKTLKTDIQPFITVKEFYKKCIDRETIDNLGTSPLMKLIEQLGGWPVLNENWNADEFQWSQTTDSIFNRGFINDYLVQMSMVVDVRNNSRNILRVHQPLVNLSYNHLYYAFLKEGLANDKIKAYFEYMLELTRLLGATEDQSSTQMMEVLDFEIEINKVSKNHLFKENHCLRSSLIDLCNNRRFKKFNKVISLHYNQGTTTKVSVYELVIICASQNT